MSRFDENTRVKFPATVQFLRIGYEYQSLKDAEIDFNTRIFKNRFKPSIERINNVTLSDSDVDKLIDEIHTLISRKDMGKEFYHRLILPNGKLKLVEFDDISKNDFAVVDELPFVVDRKTEAGSFRPDINVLINGIPLGFLEVKIPDNQGGIQKEFHRMIDDRLKNIGYDKFFNMLQFITFSNNMDYEDSDDTADIEAIKCGSFYSTPNGQNTYFNFFREGSATSKVTGFKNVSDSTIEYILKDNGYSPSEFNEPEFQTNLDLFTSCNKFITSFYEPERLMFLLHYGFCYVDCIDKDGNPYVEKHIMRYPQFFAARAILDRLEKGDKKGIIWHTQGSGKTELAAYSNRIIRDYFAKKGIVTRFFFVVDRLDMLTQATGEFTNRGLTVTSISKKSDFADELNKSLTVIAGQSNDLGNYTVVNIQKFEDSLPTSSNAYNANVQRIFYIDECHRSYKMNGEYFKNLMLCDTEGVFIALTGTPLLTKEERSNLKFGDYIHKYFYDSSIADGYTLRIKKEKIETVKREEIHRNLQLENPEADTDAIVTSPVYIESLCKYIEGDFIDFRYVNADNTIGGMIVCSSNAQAKLIGKWFDDNSKLRTGVVISDPDEKGQTQRNKTLQTEFKNNGTPDILIVHMMLTTGYDVKRLKKMYLLRNAHAQSLLQTISRVNRPYKSPVTGKVYQYGYIMDFVDINEEYERTLGEYLDELQDDAGIDDEGNLSSLIVSPDDIYKKYQQYYIQIQTRANTSGNKELFVQSLNGLGRNEIYELRKAIRVCIDCYTELRLSHSSYADEIDDVKLKSYLKLVQHKIDMLNLRDDSALDTLQVLSNDEIVELVYEFVKMKINIMNLGNLANADTNPDLKAISKTLTNIQKEIDSNKNRNQSDLVKLDELLKRIFAKLDFKNIDELGSVNSELADILDKLHEINQENERLSQKYDGQYAFVKTYTDICEQYPDFDKADVETFIGIIYEAVKNNTGKNKLLMQGRDNFITYTKKDVVTPMIKYNKDMYFKVKKSIDIDGMLNDLYTNLQLL